MLLLHASITESLANFATDLINSAGYAGIFGLILCSAFFVLPGTEVTMLFGGFSVDQHHLGLPGIVGLATLADVIGGVCIYWIGYHGVHELLERLPGPLHVGPHGMDRAHRWFERYGIWAVLVTRVLPTVRAAGPWAAGIARMPFLPFLFALTVGTFVWMLGLGLLGEAVGHQWQQWKHHLDYVDYVAIVVILGVIGWLLYTRVIKPRAGNRTATGIDG